jgi:lysophospholipase L1-like esterase
VEIFVKQKLKVAVINIVTCICLAMILEGLILVALIKPGLIPSFLLEAFRHYYQISDRNIIQVTDCGKYDSTLFYTLKPGTCLFENREFRVLNNINSMGLRDDEASLSFPSVVALGDSYTMGWGVQQDETFPQLLEQLTGMRVLNAGISSYGTARETKLLERIATDSVKYIVIQYHANDFDENEKLLSSNFRLPVRSENAYDSLREAIHKRQRYFPFKNLYGIARGFARKVAARETPGISESREAQSFLQVLKHTRIRPGIEIIVFNVDDYGKLNDDFTSAIDSLINTPEFSDLSVRTLRISSILQENDYFKLDDHINAEGHRKIAAKIRDSMASLSP